MKTDDFPIDGVIDLTRKGLSAKDVGPYLVDLWAELKDAQINALLLEALIKRYSSSEKKLHELTTSLRIKQNALLEDIGAAAAIQQTLLPQNLPVSGVIDAAWEYLPCEQIGGDIVHVSPINKDNWAVYVVDVAGHGPRAAMITVAIAQFLQSSAEDLLMSPENVMLSLDQAFPFTRFNSFFTVIYGVQNLHDRIFRFCNSGHPLPVFMEPGKFPRFVEGNGPMLGLGLPLTWPEISVELRPDTGLMLYTDGLVECVNASGQSFGDDRLLQMLERLQGKSASETVSQIMREMRLFMGETQFQDDFTLLLGKGIG